MKPFLTDEQAAVIGFMLGAASLMHGMYAWAGVLLLIALSHAFDIKARR